MADVSPLSQKIVAGGHMETTFLFERLSVALQRGNAVSFHNTIVTE